MQEEFAKRCLYKSLTFLTNLNIETNKNIVLLPKDQHLITLFNQKEYFQIQKTICYGECQCCAESHKFLYYYTQKIQKAILKLGFKETIKANDIYNEYLNAIELTGKEKIMALCNILKKNNYFYECFDELLYHVDQSNFFSVEKELECIDDEITKRIYFMLIYVHRFLKSDNFDIYFEEVLNYFKINKSKNFNEKENNEYKPKTFKTKVKPNPSNYIISLVAGVYYTKKDNETALILFKKTMNETVSFLDLYSNILFIKHDMKSSALLVHYLSLNYPTKPETYVAMGNYYSLMKEHTKAISYFQKCIELDERFSGTNTLIAHEYESLKDYNKAIKYFNQSLKFNKNDYRALFGMAEYYKEMGLNELALSFYKKVCEIQPDNTYFLIKFGEMLNPKDAAHVFRKVIKMGDAEGYLKMAECYKKVGDLENAVSYFEKYSEKKNDSVVREFLKEYFLSRNDMRKYDYYAKKEN